jgi:hypothetical protein
MRPEFSFSFFWFGLLMRREAEVKKMRFENGNFEKVPGTRTQTINFFTSMQSSVLAGATEFHRKFQRGAKSSIATISRATFLARYRFLRSG